MKYPKTLHLPWSPGITNDDKVTSMNCVNNLIEGRIVITEKLDGECTTVSKNNIFARSENSSGNGDFTKQYVLSKQYSIPENIYLVGESIDWIHSIDYKGRFRYPFHIFAAYSNDKFLSFSETWKLSKSLDIKYVPILYQGIISLEDLKDFHNNLGTKLQEGYVIRNESDFLISQFDKNVFKWVRKNHVQTNQHWLKTKEKTKFIK